MPSKGWRGVGLRPWDQNCKVGWVVPCCSSSDARRNLRVAFIYLKRCGNALGLANSVLIDWDACCSALSSSPLCAL